MSHSHPPCWSTLSLLGLFQSESRGLAIVSSLAESRKGHLIELISQQQLTCPEILLYVNDRSGIRV